MKTLSVIGARPQFIKAAVLNRELIKIGIEDRIVHTGQHYDRDMSDVFFEELHIPKPAYVLEVGSASHGAQTGEMMKRLEPVMLDAAPDRVIVYGDTNTTLAGALVAAKLGLPVIHVEAGLRSYNRSMPEEINRVVVDHVAGVHFAPNMLAARQLHKEGITSGVFVVGDLMIDLATETARALPARPAILGAFGVTRQRYALATVHRAYNTEALEHFAPIAAALRALAPMPVIFPVHPRTRALAAAIALGNGDNVIMCDPLSYMKCIALQQHAAVILTDSGGMQKEAAALRVPCVTLREETEWTETLEGGWNVLAGNNPADIVRAARRERPRTPPPYETCGGAARLMAETLYALAVAA